MPRFRTLTVGDLLTQSPPEWLIEGLVGQHSYAVLFGASGAGKSFLAIDLALSIATGRPWAGRATKRGAVVYVAAEGREDLPLRVQAWLEHNGVEWGDLGEVLFIVDAPQLHNPDEVEALIADVLAWRERPALIIMDTLAASNVGGKEDNPDMNIVNGAVRRIQDETGATVVFTHHTPVKDLTRERGGGALRAAADSMIRVEGRDGISTITVRSIKQRWSKNPDPIHLRKKEVSFDAIADLQPRSSLVLLRGGPAPLGDSDLHVLRALQGIATWTEWKQEATSGRGAISAATFNRAVKALLEDGYVEQLESRAYRQTEYGAAAARK